MLRAKYPGTVVLKRGGQNQHLEGVLERIPKKIRFKLYPGVGGEQVHDTG